VNGFDHRGLADDQVIVVTPQLLAAVVRGRRLELLDIGAHGAIENHDVIAHGLQVTVIGEWVRFQEMDPLSAFLLQNLNTAKKRVLFSRRQFEWPRSAIILRTVTISSGMSARQML